VHCAGRKREETREVLRVACVRDVWRRAARHEA
jgi:hypothetical protein